MIRLSTLGAVDLRRDGEELRQVLLQPKRLAVLTWLATARPVGYHSRDSIVGLFWPESDQERARNALRQALHFLRRAVGDDVLVSRGDREVAVDPERFWCDAAAFDRALAEGRAEEALELYRGDFLPGFFIEEAPEAERWLEDERDRRRRAAVDAALGLVKRDEAAGDLRAAAGWARRASLIVPADEPVHRTLLALLERAGDHAAALDAHEQFAKRLEAEYGLPVGKETAAIVERIRRRPKVVAVTEGGRQMVGTAETAQTAGTAGTAERAGTAAGAGPTPAMPATSRYLLWPVALAAVVTVAGLALWLGRRPGATPTADASTAIAVLPFANLTGDGANDFLADGLADEVINGLSELQGLRVMARTSSFAWKGKAVAPDSIARALRVTHLVQGSLRRAGDSLRVTAQLVEAASGVQRWSHSWDGSARNTLALETAISRGVAEALSPVLGQEAKSLAPETRDPALRDRFLRIRAALRGQPNIQIVIDSVRAVLRADSTYARAWAYLGSLYAYQAYYRQAPAADGYANAVAAARRALRLRPDEADAYAVLARVADVRDWDVREADRLYRKAIELRPSNASTHMQRAFLLLRLRQNDEALAEARSAVRIDPYFAGTWNALAAVHELRLNFDSAAAAYRTALSLAPRDFIILTNMVTVEAERGRMAEAWAALDSAAAPDPSRYLVRKTRAWLLARTGRRAEARALDDSLERVPGASPVHSATVAALLGDTARALTLLERAVAERDDFFPYVPVISEFDALRDAPRYRALVARLGLSER